MDLGLADRVYVITGASRGLGLASARALVAEGARVAIVARPSDALDAAVTALGTSAIAVPADLADADAAEHAVESALAAFGRLDGARALVGTDLPPFVDCWLYVGVLTTAAHTRVALGDVEAATTLRRLLVPHLGLLGSVGTGIACGDVALALGRLDLFLGDHDAARAMADRSVATCDAGGAGPWLVRALLFRAGVTGDDADRERAAGIVDRLDLQLLRHRI